ncbi:hypothetical protein Cadr_000028750 [Camelus dromedarius]|uniref:Uncharacterized protein n=1 Tax=Camelus dromedarius TaxID=9838 RepID=A0A5N4C815_CAMDR|nr:hypothetical protein Cadr_000028750 [Camelus dromedarius]KAB1255019.1 hypothetical protein Cadr_000028750 [Camelus dromedarius]KAB1255021.1 hypothetical protein Cadr_000028750 [Camelus dromedarius]
MHVLVERGWRLLVSQGGAAGSWDWLSHDDLSEEAGGGVCKMEAGGELRRRRGVALLLPWTESQEAGFRAELQSFVPCVFIKHVLQVRHRPGCWSVLSSRGRHSPQNTVPDPRHPEPVPEPLSL